jgi:serine protease Do
MNRTLLLAASIAFSRLEGQQMTMSSAGGEVIGLATGQFAVLKTASDGVVVDNVITDPAPAGAVRVGLEAGDRIVALQGEAVVALDLFVAAYRTIAQGTEITLRLSRAGRETAIRFPKPAPQQRMMAVGGAAGGPAGAWSAASPGGAAASTVTIAGAHIVENTQGMPEVSHRASHPAAASVALRVGDVITAIDGRSIAALAGLQLFYAAVPIDAEVTLKVRRANQDITVTFRKPADK